MSDNSGNYLKAMAAFTATLLAIYTLLYLFGFFYSFYIQDLSHLIATQQARVFFYFSMFNSLSGMLQLLSVLWLGIACFLLVRYCLKVRNNP